MAKRAPKLSALLSEYILFYDFFQFISPKVKYS